MQCQERLDVLLVAIRAPTGGAHLLKAHEQLDHFGRNDELAFLRQTPFDRHGSPSLGSNATLADRSGLGRLGVEIKLTNEPRKRQPRIPLNRDAWMRLEALTTFYHL